MQERLRSAAETPATDDTSTATATESPANDGSARSHDRQDDRPRRIALRQDPPSATRREAHANDQGQASSLVAVTARSNGRRPTRTRPNGCPPPSEALCRYASEWTAIKLRWGLTVDEPEGDTLMDSAAGWGGTEVEFTPAA
ncbi:hypothetical protein [Streptomyces virginiae]|uniref:hypothetical protein n=1 Tax=Streptomyces virginiae TaxID=1961 RepID=UPI00344681C7